MMDPGTNLIHFASVGHAGSDAPTAGSTDNQHDSGAVLSGAPGAMGTLSNLIGTAKNVGPLQVQRAARLEPAIQE